jgi:hypothetical protein
MQNAHPLIGVVPYACEILKATGLVDGFFSYRLLEQVGDEEVITPDPDTTYFAKGTVGFARRTGEAHVSTGLPRLEIAHARDAIQ